MPSTVLNVLDRLRLPLNGHAKWGRSIASKAAGIYFVSLSPDPGSNLGTCIRAPISAAAAEQWITRVPIFTLGGVAQPPAKDVVEFLGRFWLPDENIVYIGKATQLGGRTHQLFRHTLGRRSPHAGGHWIKTLSCLERLYVYFSECPSADAALAKERGALDVFAMQVSADIRSRLPDPNVAIPYANLRNAEGNRKQNSISHSVLR